jgi:hypothetical protein
MILHCLCRIQQNYGQPFEWEFEIQSYPNIHPNFSIENKLKNILAERAGVGVDDIKISFKKDELLNAENVYKQVINTYYKLECANNVFVVDMAITSSYIEAQIRLNSLQAYLNREIEMIKQLMVK